MSKAVSKRQHPSITGKTSSLSRGGVFEGAIFLGRSRLQKCRSLHGQALRPGLGPQEPPFLHVRSDRGVFTLAKRKGLFLPKGSRKEKGDCNMLKVDGLVCSTLSRGAKATRVSQWRPLTIPHIIQKVVVESEAALGPVFLGGFVGGVPLCKGCLLCVLRFQAWLGPLQANMSKPEQDTGIAPCLRLRTS